MTNVMHICTTITKLYFAALISVLCIMSARCDESSAPQEWYTPDGFESEVGHGKLNVGPGGKTEIDVTIDTKNGDMYTTDGRKITGHEKEFGLSMESQNALEAIRQSFIAEMEIKTLPGDSRPIGNFETYENCDASHFALYMIGAIEDDSPSSVFNGEYCPYVMNQFGRGICATTAAITYANFFLKMHGKGEMKFNVNRLHEKAEMSKRKFTSEEGTRSIDNLLNVCYQLRKSIGELLCCKFYFYASNRDLDSVRALVKKIVANHGGFIAGMNASIEWRELNHLRNNDNLTTITGKIKETWGTHDVLVFGYDEDYVYFQNSWGYNWGHYGQARIAWAEFVREFESGLFVVKADGMPD